MAETAVVTGAGSGVGRAVAVALLRQGWRVALVGRREAALRETAALSGTSAEAWLVAPCDIRDESAVNAMAETVLASLGAVAALVNAAGTNTPARSFAALSGDDYRRLIETNLNGAFYCLQAFLPGMRQRGEGTIVNVVSDAGKLASAKAGPAYAASKFGLAGLTQALNAEERSNGIRACAIFPGDIDTPLLDLRPVPPSGEARALMLKPEEVAACVLLALTLPAHAVLEELVIRPR
ncbi:MAG: SDR family NAD(P)-dependent oxidoreductase [Truepera sp.]|nr:SDR family NAD(P)-dependent oxidoreductase [Truepera sp.]